MRHVITENMCRRLSLWAHSVKRDIHAIYLASGDPRVPWLAKAMALFVAAYALSPLDLIPDFVPVLGYLDDLILVPFGIYLVVRMIPPEILAEHRKAAVAAQRRPSNQAAAIVIVTIWALSIAWAGWMTYVWLRPD